MVSCNSCFLSDKQNTCLNKRQEERRRVRTFIEQRRQSNQETERISNFQLKIDTHILQKQRWYLLASQKVGKLIPAPTRPQTIPVILFSVLRNLIENY